MPGVVWCVSLEWGWEFLLPSLAIALALVTWFAVLIWRGGGHLIFSYEKIKVMATGNPVSVVATVILIGLVSFGIYEGYKAIKDAYFVALNTPGRELGQVRDDLQSETHVEVTIKDPAKKFVIAGSYQGACVADLFHSICRRYADRIMCDTLTWNRTLIVDLKKP